MFQQPDTRPGIEILGVAAIIVAFSFLAGIGLAVTAMWHYEGVAAGLVSLDMLVVAPLALAGVLYVGHRVVLSRIEETVERERIRRMVDRACAKYGWELNDGPTRAGASPMVTNLGAVILESLAASSNGKPFAHAGRVSSGAGKRAGGRRDAVLRRVERARNSLASSHSTSGAVRYRGRHVGH